MYGYRWCGMVIVSAGLCVVGVSSMLGDGGSNSHARDVIVGLLFIIVCQFFSAVQMVVEEVLLKNRNFPPLQIVGMEGIIGTLLMTFVILPAMYFIPGSNQGSYENSLDAIQMIQHNYLLLSMILVYWISIGFYNFCGLSVTKQLTAVHRTLIDSLRTVLVWGIDIVLYFMTGGSFGESWNKYSWVQVIGFLLLIFGTLTYNAVLRFPGLYYEPKSATIAIPPTPTPTPGEEEEEKRPLLTPKKWTPIN